MNRLGKALAAPYLASFTEQNPPEAHAREVRTADEIAVVEFLHNAVSGPDPQLAIEVGQSFEFLGLHLQWASHGVTKKQGALTLARHYVRLMPWGMSWRMQRADVRRYRTVGVD